MEDYRDKITSVIVAIFAIVPIILQLTQQRDTQSLVILSIILIVVIIYFIYAYFREKFSRIDKNEVNLKKMQKRFDEMKHDFEFDKRLAIVEKIVEFKKTNAKGAIKPDIVIIIILFILLILYLKSIHVL